MMQPIETIYKGYRMRSRLEARWAVFFDTLGIDYEYEKEGYELSGLRYLPDFWLPSHECFVEIKGGEPTQEEYEKALRLSEQSSYPVYILIGAIRIPGIDTRPTPAHYCAIASKPGGKRYQIVVRDCYWCECPACCQVHLEPAGRCSCVCLEPLMSFYLHLRDRPQGQEERREQYEAHQDWLSDKFTSRFESLLTTIDTPRLISAYTAARQARFEFGEEGTAQ